MIRTPLHERIVSGLGTAAVIGGLGLMLVFGLSVKSGTPRESRLLLVPVDRLPPPEPEKPREPRHRPAPVREAPSPPNLKALPTDIVAPPPVILLPPPPTVAAPIAGPGTAASAGASDRAGPGFGAGGEGNGRGDGEGGEDTPPRLIKGRLRFSDLPEGLKQAGIGGAVAVRYRITTEGRVTECAIDRSSGNADLDAETCRLIGQRFRFRPSRDGAGRPIGSIIVETHEWIVPAPPPAQP
jgi:protein TonB